MELEKLYPWNWFKHEKTHKNESVNLPVKRGDYNDSPMSAPSFNRFHHEIDRLFDEALNDFGFSHMMRSPMSHQMPGTAWMSPFHASLNVASDSEKYSITMEAPGLEQKDLTITLRDRDLLIKGDKQEESEDRDKHFYRIERRYGSFERVLSIPDDADIDNIDASMKNGVLSIKIPRFEVPESKVRTITISED